MGGKDRVIALQTGGTQLSRPQEYTTPAGGTASFSFVGDAPGATVAFSQTADGYDDDQEGDYVGPDVSDARCG